MAKILIVDDEIQIREMLHKFLTSKGYAVTTMPSAEQALDILFREPFDLILLDLFLIDGSGLSILKKIRAHNKSLPVIIYTESVTLGIKEQALAAGATEVLPKDIDIAILLRKINENTASPASTERKISAEGSQPLPKEKAEKSILIVDDEESIRHILIKFFKTKGYGLQQAENGKKAVELVATGEKFSVVLLDIQMPEMDGITTLKKLLEIDPSLCVIMVTGEQADENVQKALELGASGYVLKPFDFLYLDLVVSSKMSDTE
ncbi:MAG: response regulator [Candidatus Omnitrophica bacterium]|nr:response regulator [Candidatus Omnitrophota bacterium]